MESIAIIAYLRGFGGTERSLIDFISVLDKSKYEITVVHLGNQGSKINSLPKEIPIIETTRQSSKEIIRRMLSERKFFKAFHYLFLRMLRKYSKRIRFSWYQPEANNINGIKKHFDHAICWALPDSFEVFYTAKYIRARKKYLWIHMDLNHYTTPKDAEKVYLVYNRIICVSEACKTAFISKYPGLKNRVVKCYNILDERRIIELANLPNPYNNDCFNIVTCGRLSKEKRPLFAIEIAKKLREKGIEQFKWYFVGDGPYYDQLKKAARDNDLDEHIILLGVQQNPYVFIKHADLFVQMSSHESFCLTLAEAQILNTPCVTTCFPSSYEIIQDGVTGLIAGNNAEDLFNSIFYLISNRSVLYKIKENITKKKLREYVGKANAFECVLEDHR